MEKDKIFEVFQELPTSLSIEQDGGLGGFKNKEDEVILVGPNECSAEEGGDRWNGNRSSAGASLVRLSCSEYLSNCQFVLRNWPTRCINVPTCCPQIRFVCSGE